jgi:tetratricopeptide (TPR) repeat protein
MLGFVGVCNRLASRQREVLEYSSRDPNSRHRTLRNAIAWSWALLTSDEQSLLSQCAVFRGGFSLEALEHVAEIAHTSSPTSVADLAHVLHDKSLLHVETDRSGARRLGLYLSVREYAREQLDASGSTMSAIARHAAYYLPNATQAGTEEDHPVSSQALGWLERERDNVLAIVDRAMGPGGESIGGASAALAALVALVPLALRRGPIAAYVARLDGAIEGLSRDGDPILRARALLARCQLRAGGGAVSTVGDDAREAQELSRRAGVQALEGRALFFEGAVLAHALKSAEARGAWERALSLHRASGDRVQHARTVRALGLLAMNLGDAVEGRRSLIEALDLCRAMGDVRGQAIVYDALGWSYMGSDDLDESTRCFESGISLAHEAGDPMLELNLRGSLGVLFLARGNLRPAREQLEKAIVAARSIGAPPIERSALLHNALVTWEMGERESAREQLERVTRAAQEANDRRGELLYGAFLAGVEASLGLIDQAVVRLDAVDSIVGLDDRLRTVSSLQRAIVELVLARKAAERGDPVTAETHHATASKRLGAAHGTSAHPANAWTESRLAARLVEREIDAYHAAGGSSLPKAEPATGTLVIQQEGHWFRLPSGKRVDCQRRTAIRRILAELAKQRIDSPGKLLAVAALIAVGWPGERIRESSARSRLFVSIATLRRLGLRDLLQSDPQGYRLDPAVKCQLAT